MKTVHQDLVQSIGEQVAESARLAELIAVLRRTGGSSERPQVSGLAGSSSAFVLAQVQRILNRPLLVVLGDKDTAEGLRDDLDAILAPARVLYLPEFETSPYDVRSPHLAILDARIHAMSELLLGTTGIVVTTAVSLATQVVAPEVLRRGTMALAPGDPLDADELAHWFADIGYRRVPLVEEQGDVARRGGIVDVFSFGLANPVRIEFEGDEIVSLREFEPTTQRSIGPIEKVVLLPRREMVIDEAGAEAAASAVRAAAGTTHDAELHASQLLHERYYVGMRRIAGFLDQGWGSLARYFPANMLTVFESPRRLAERVEGHRAELEDAYAERLRHHELVSSPASFLLDWPAAAGELVRHPGFDLEPVRRASGMAGVLRSLDPGVSLPPEVAAIAGAELPDEEVAPVEVVPGITAGKIGAGQPRIHFGVKAQESFGRDPGVLRAFLHAQGAAGMRTIVLCDNPGQRDHLRDLIAGGGESPIEAEIEVGRLAGGFLWRDIRLCVLTDHEIFGRFRRRRSRRRFRAGVTIPDLMALKPGDYVVHVDHGIGVYRGTQRLTVGGHETDCLEIHYQRGDKLFIPADQFDLVTKYPLEEGQGAPSVSRLGGTQWARTKEKAKKAIQEMTDELLKMSAMRGARQGFSFSTDTAWQRDMESAFIYDETPDQERAIIDIKQDMEASKPMDRLVCGDVGYGKTEVAVRAAFKAVQDRKQVAVLVPTTILAQQHHGTFSERLEDFPVRVEVLSRFRTAREQADVVAGLKGGEVDIVIGTHRLLQKDVEFRDLGLIVVDEEHRFGVKDKERLKQLKALADVITLTATPIPRTLHLALSGARDISLITTPPRDRVPIHTEICEFDRDLIADALLREADRGGQSFFVHNRVQSMDAMAGFLKRICPQLRLAVAHGQMGERVLEKVIVDFMDRKYDVLITTMIIESGVDMPSVNTMLVNRADRFGLAQLYQLRGARRAVEPARPLLPSRAAASRADRERRAPPARHRGLRRARGGAQDRDEGSRDPRCGEPPGSATAWTHRGGGIRPLLPAG